MNPPKVKTIARQGSQLDWVDKRAAYAALPTNAYLVLDRLQSFATGWETSAAWISSAMRLGLSTVYRALRTLKTGGYLLELAGSWSVSWAPQTDSRQREPAGATYYQEKVNPLAESPRALPQPSKAPETTPEVAAVLHAFESSDLVVSPKRARNLLGKVAAVHVRPLAYIRRRVEDMTARRLALGAMLRFIVADAPADNAKVSRRLASTLCAEVETFETRWRDYQARTAAEPEPEPIPTTAEPGAEWSAALHRLAEWIPGDRLRAVFEPLRIVAGELVAPTEFVAVRASADSDLIARAVGRPMVVRHG